MTLCCLEDQRLTFHVLFLSGENPIINDIVLRQQRKRKKLLEKLEKLEEKETPKRGREGRVSEERQGKEEEEDEEKEGKTAEQKEDGERVTEAVSKPHEEERTVQPEGKKVYFCTLTKHFLEVSLASGS